MPVQHVFLIGPSGVGKSTVGALLATVLGRPFHDSDAAVERATGRSVARLFAESGEPAFRARERRVLEDLAAGPAAVIAVGAGALLDPQCGATLARRGAVVLLDADPDALVARLGAAADRPLLAEARDHAARKARIEAQRLARDPIFRALAHHRIATDGMDAAAVAAAVAAWLATASR